MNLIIEERSTWVETSPTAALSTINLTRNSWGSDRNLHSEKPATDHLNHGKLFKTLTVFSKQTCLFKHQRGFTPSPVKAAGAIKICTEALNIFGSLV
jgi:hypothetical protein